MICGPLSALVSGESPSHEPPAQHCQACAGLDKNTAKKVLQVWEQSGASSPDELRKLLVKRSVQSAGVVLVQTLLDAGALSIPSHPLSANTPQQPGSACKNTKALCLVLGACSTLAI